MNIIPKHTIRLLALAEPPKSGRTILDWKPFNRKTLGRFVDDHNQKCIEEYVRLGWLPEYIETIAERIDVVLNDLSNVNELRSDEYATIGILVINLEVIDKINAQLAQIKLRMATHQHEYHLPQISQRRGAVSTADSFLGLPIISPRPAIFYLEEEFEGFLEKLCYVYRTTIDAIPLSPPPLSGGPGDRRAVQEYVDRIPKLASSVRDAAIARDLTDEETIVLAQRAAEQELALSRLAERVRSGERRKVRVGTLREMIFDIPVGPVVTENPLEEFQLVRLDVAHPMRILKATQREALGGLGLNRKGHTGVFFDEPELWERVERLGAAVKATRISATLPRWGTSMKSSIA